MIDRKQQAMEAKINPQSWFDSPLDVVRDRQFTAEQKLQILRSWEVDARELQVAEEENMAGGETDRLAEVREAITILKKNAGHAS